MSSDRRTFEYGQPFDESNRLFDLIVGKQYKPAVNFISNPSNDAEINKIYADGSTALLKSLHFMRPFRNEPQRDSDGYQIFNTSIPMALLNSGRFTHINDVINDETALDKVINLLNGNPGNNSLRNLMHKLMEEGARRASELSGGRRRRTRKGGRRTRKSRKGGRRHRKSRRY